MTETIIIAILSLCGTLFGSLAGIMTANKLTNFRIEALEKKVEKHNNLMERVALNERDDETQWKRIDELRADLEEMRKEMAA